MKLWIMLCILYRVRYRASQETDIKEEKKTLELDFLFVM